MLIKEASNYYKSYTPKTFRPLATYTYLTYIKFLSFNRTGQPISRWAKAIRIHEPKPVYESNIMIPMP